MRVPVRRAPETRVSEQQLGYARAVQPLNTEPLTHVIEGFRDQLLDEQDARQRVGLNRELLQEVNSMQSDFVARQHDPEVSPVDFAHNTDTEYQQRHQALIGRLRTEGYHSDLLDEFDNRLGTVRQGFFERGLTYQAAQLTSRANEEIEDVAHSASQYAAVDPVHNYATARDMVRESVRTHPDLLEDQRAATEDQQLAVVRDASARALAIQNPQLIIDTLDPHGLTAPTPTGTPAASGTVPPVAANSWQGVATGVAGELGLDPVDVAAVMHYESAGSFSPTRMGGRGNNYMGLIQFGPDERRQYGITTQSTPQEWTTAILGYMHDRGFRRGMSLLDFYSTINAGRPGRYDASDGPGNTVRSHYERILRDHRGPAEQWLRAAATSVAPAEPVREGAPVAGSQLTDEIQPVTLPASQSDQQHAADSVAPAHDLSIIHTGNALLDDLDGRERLQVLGLAREQMNRVTASQRAQMDVTIGNITAEAMNNGGEIATAIPQEADVLRVYGAVEGPQRWAQIRQSQATGQAITTFRTRSAADIQTSLDAIRPTPGSPTYATQLQIYEHAQQAAQTLLTAREHDPAGYVMQYFPAVREAAQQGTAQYYAALDRAYQTLGIDTRTAPLMTTQAREQLTEQYRTMSPTQRREFMRQNWSMGEDRFRRFVHGMEGTTAETDANIFALMHNYPRAAGPIGSIYQQILEGREMIAQDPAKRPQAAQVTALFRQQGLSAITDLNAEASNAIQEATEGLYVQRGGDPVTLNPRLYRESLATVLGGSLPVAMGHGQASQYHTILPPGINQQQFQSWIERQTERSLQMAAVGHAIPRYSDLRTTVPIQDIIDQGAFVMTSPGHYMIRMASDGRPLMNHQGQPLLLNLSARDIMR